MSHPVRTYLLAAGIGVVILGCGGARKEVPVTPEPSTKGEPVVIRGIVAEITAPPTQLTSDPSNNGLASYHPGGEKFVFQSDRDGHWQIYQQSFSDGLAEHLVTSESNDENPVWMPDSSGILFTSDRNGGGKEFARDIFFYDPNSVLTATLADDAADDWYPVPVGSEGYLFLSERGANQDTSQYFIRNQLFMGGLSGTVPQLIADTEVDPASPADLGDGRYLVRAKGGQLAALSGDNSLELLTPPNLVCGTISYNKGRNVAAFNGREGDTYKLYLFNLGTKTLQEVDTGSGEVRYPQFSPDGNRILYSEEVDSRFQVFQLYLAQ
jgi:Tol biopolymer transport system component